MNEADQREYLEGKVQGLERLCQALINSTEQLWGDLPSGLEWRLGFRSELVDLIAGLEKGNAIITIRAQGQRDALAEFASKFFSC